MERTQLHNEVELNRNSLETVLNAGHNAPQVEGESHYYWLLVDPKGNTDYKSDIVGRILKRAAILICASILFLYFHQIIVGTLFIISTALYVFLANKRVPRLDDAVGLSNKRIIFQRFTLGDPDLVKTTKIPLACIKNTYVSTDFLTGCPMVAIQTNTYLVESNCFSPKQRNDLVEFVRKARKTL